MKLRTRATIFAHIPNSDAESMQPVYFIASCVISSYGNDKAAIVPAKMVYFQGSAVDEFGLEPGTNPKIFEIFEDDFEKAQLTEAWAVGIFP